MEVEMARVHKEVRISFRQVDTTPEEIQQRLDDVFDLLFEEVSKSMTEGQAMFVN